jgi:hypothetical protein
MPRRRRLLLFALIAGTAIVGTFAAWLLWPHSAITRENAAKIQMDMTLAEVEELLGGPARNESNMPDNFINDAFVVARHRGAQPFEERRWASPGFVVLVHFDDSGRVIRLTNFDFNVDRSLIDKLRRWLRL